MQIDGQDGLVISAEKVAAMHLVAQQDGVKKFFLSEDKGGNVRVSELVEVPAYFRRKAISLTGVQKT